MSFMLDAWSEVWRVLHWKNAKIVLDYEKITEDARTGHFVVVVVFFSQVFTLLCQKQNTIRKLSKTHNITTHPLHIKSMFLEIIDVHNRKVSLPEKLEVSPISPYNGCVAIKAKFSLRKSWGKGGVLEVDFTFFESLCGWRLNLSWSALHYYRKSIAETELKTN